MDLDQPASWQRSLPVALQLARDNGAKLHLMTVVPTFGMSIVSGYFPEGFEKKAMATANQRLRALIETHCPDPAGVTAYVGHGTIYAEILSAVARLGCDLIVMSSHRPALED